MADFEITPAYIMAAANNPGVTAHLAVVAARIKKRAEGIAKDEGVEMEVTTQAGVRPGGRPFVNVISDNADQEFGTSRTRRRRVLGRAGDAG